MNPLTVRPALLLPSLLAALPLAALAAGDPPRPPEAARRDHLQTWHGDVVNDPWFWLREKENPEVRRHLEAENAYTAAMTADIASFASALYDEMLARVKQTDLDVPERRGAFCYYKRTEEGLQYPIHARRPAGAKGACDDSGAEQVLLDLNQLAAGRPFVSLGVYRPSDDGKKLLYSIDETGFRQYRLHVKDLATGKLDGPLAERVTSAEWAADSATILFTTEDEVTKRSDTAWRLRLGGRSAKAAEKLYFEKDERFLVEAGRTKDRRFVVLSSLATDTWEQRILDARKPSGAFRVVLPRTTGHKYSVEHRAGRLYIVTNAGAKDFRVVSAPVETPSPAGWRPFLAGKAGDKVVDLEMFKDFAVATVKRAGVSRFLVHDFRTGKWRELDFAEPVYSASPTVTPEFDSTLFRFRYQSLVTPPAVYDEDLAKGKRALLKQEPVLGGYDPALYESARVWVTARDGVKVPVSMVHRKGLARDGKAPLLLYAYGSYGYGTAAAFNLPRVSLLDRGVIYAIAHVRGGDEMGEAWHDDGMLMKKKNTFRDFVDVALHLVKERWTSSDRLVIEGGSAGGLLMGAVVNDRPDLFRAVHAAVPFVDVMNTMMDASLPGTVTEYLEWGDPNEKVAFDYMRSYSPYDNLVRGRYPAMLVTTSLNDSQVMYWEPAKYVAKLRTLKTDPNPLLFKIKLEPAGHGGASGRYDRLRDRAFELAWMLSQVGITR